MLILPLVLAVGLISKRMARSLILTLSLLVALVLFAPTINAQGPVAPPVAAPVTAPVAPPVAAPVTAPVDPPAAPTAPTPLVTPTVPTPDTAPQLSPQQIVVVATLPAVLGGIILIFVLGTAIWYCTHRNGYARYGDYYARPVVAGGAFQP